MNLRELSGHIGRNPEMQAVGSIRRCFYQSVMFADKLGVCAVTTTIIGCGPNEERAKEDLVLKIRGKVARVFDGLGAYKEFPVPKTLTVR